MIPRESPSPRNPSRISGAQLHAADEDEDEEDAFEAGVFPRVDRGSSRSSSSGSSSRGGGRRGDPTHVLQARPGVLPNFTSPPTTHTNNANTSDSGCPSASDSVNHATGSGTVRTPVSQQNTGAASSVQNKLLSPPLSPASMLTLPAATSSSTTATPVATFGALPGSPLATASSSNSNGGSQEELWVSIERYLMAVYTALHKDDEGELRNLKGNRHRMGWYTVVYNACNASPANSREMYARLALVVLHALEVFVTFPMLQHADRSRLEILTGQEKGAAGGGSGKGETASREGVKTPTLKNGSFRFVRRLLFGDAEGHHSHRDPQRGTAAKHESEPFSPMAAASAAGLSSPFFGLDTPLLHQHQEVSSPLSVRSNSNVLSHQPGAGREECVHPQPRQSSFNVGTLGVTPLGEFTPSRGTTPVPQGSGPASDTISRNQSSWMATLSLQPRSPSPALISQDTGRVLVDEDEELLLPEASRTPPDSTITMPSSPFRGEQGMPSSSSRGAVPASVTRTATPEGSERSASGPAQGRHSGSLQPPPQQSQKPAYSSCSAFCDEYAMFDVFCRVVLSCFKYLDQYYTKRFGMDTITTMCVKLFYVVVYEPVKPLLMDELFTRLARLREFHSKQHCPVVGYGVGGKATGADASEIERNAGPPDVGSDNGNNYLMASGGDTVFRSDVQLVQQTLSTVTKLIVSVQTTASYLVAADASAGSGGAAASGRQSPAVRGLVARQPAATAAQSRTGSVSPAAASTPLQVAGNGSFAGAEAPSLSSATHGNAATRVSSSAPTSATSTPRFRPSDLFTRSPGSSTAGMTPVGSSSSGLLSAPASTSTAAAAAVPAPKDTKRRRLIDIFKASHHSHKGSAPADPTAPATARSSSSHRASQGNDRTDTSTGHACDGSYTHGNSPVTQHDSGGSDAVFGGSGSGVPQQPMPLIVDLRGIVEVRERLESRSLPHSLATQAIRHFELYGSGGNTAAAGVGSGQQQQQPLIGTIIKEIGKPLNALIGDDFGDKYLLVLEHFYRNERPRRTSTPEARRGYVRWAHNVFALERFLLKDVATPFVHAAVQAVLSTVLLVEVHRSIILDPESGFRRLLEVWAGSRPDDAFVVSILGEAATAGAKGGNYGSAKGLLSPIGAPSLFQARASVAGGGSGGGDFTLSHSASGGFDAGAVPPQLHVRTLSSSSVQLMSVSTATAVYTAPSQPLSAEVRAQAVGFYYDAFALSSDESCGLLMATVLATKVIHDGAALLSSYLDAVTSGGAVGNSSLCHMPTTSSFPASPTPSAVQGGSQVRLSRVRGQRTLPLLVPQPTQTPEAATAAAGRALAEGLVDLYSRYAELIRCHVHETPVLRRALTDAMTVVLNPCRWARSGAAAAAAVSSGEAEAMAGASSTATSSGSPQGCLPNVLLNRDAGPKATAPLSSLAATDPRAVRISVPALLAAYCNHLFTHQLTGGVTEVRAELKARLGFLGQMVALFDDKDVFLELYKEWLARRLLASTPNIDAEGVMVQQLQQHLSVGSVHAFEAMLRDYVNSKASFGVFEKTDAYKGLATKLDVQLLSSAQWPSYRVIPLIPPASLQKALMAFEAYYLRLHPSRTLRWLHLLGSARLTAEFPRGCKDITANTLQAVLLLLVSEAYHQCPGDGARDTPVVGEAREGEKCERKPLAAAAGGLIAGAERGVAAEDLAAVRPSDRSPTASFYTTDTDSEMNAQNFCSLNEVDYEDTTRDMHTIPSISSSVHAGDIGGVGGTPSPRDVSELEPSSPHPPPATAAAAAAAASSTSFGIGTAQRLTAQLANLTTSALSTYRARLNISTAERSDHDGEEDESEASRARRRTGRQLEQEVQATRPHLGQRHGSITGEALARTMGLPFEDIRAALASVVQYRGVPLLVCLSDSAESASAYPHNDNNSNVSASGSLPLQASPTPSTTTATTSAGVVTPLLTTAPRALQPSDRFTLNVRFTHRLRRLQLPPPRVSRVAEDSSAKDWGGGGGGGGPSGLLRPLLRDSGSSMTAKNSAAATDGTEGGAREESGGFGEMTRVPANLQAVRRQQLDAAIVRIMKSHREVRHSDLVRLVTQQVSKWFIPTARDIKAQMEALVERGFIVRSQEDENVFVYNA